MFFKWQCSANTYMVISNISQNFDFAITCLKKYSSIYQNCIMHTYVCGISSVTIWASSIAEINCCICIDCTVCINILYICHMNYILYCSCDVPRKVWSTFHPLWLCRTYSRTHIVVKWLGWLNVAMNVKSTFYSICRMDTYLSDIGLFIWHC